MEEPVVASTCRWKCLCEGCLYPANTPRSASPPSETSGLWHSCWDQGAGKIRLLERSGTLQCSGGVKLLRVPCALI